MTKADVKNPLPEVGTRRAKIASPAAGLGGPIRVGRGGATVASVDANVSPHEETESLFRAVFDQSAVGVSCSDFDGVFIRVNQRFCDITGYSAEELVGRRFADITHPDDVTIDDQLGDELIAGKRGPYTLEKRYIDKLGKTVWVRLTVTLARTRGGVPYRLIGIVEDISEVIRAEQALRASEARLREAHRIAHLATYEVDHRNESRSWSDELFAILELEPSTEGPSFELFAQRIHPEDKILVETAGADSLANRTPYDLTHRLVMPDGRVKYVQVRGRTTYGADGRPLRSFGTVQDVTVQKQSELALRHAKETAESANRAKSDFLANMSHELRTPLNAVLGYAQLLETERAGPLQDKQREYLRDIMSGGKHLLELIQDILELAKTDAGRIGLKIEPIDAFAVIDDALPLIESMGAAQAIILQVARPAAPCPLVLADRVRLRQVFLNLLTNAIKYNRPGGRVDIACSEVRPGFLRISVSDTGNGIPPERQSELFVPFNRLGAETLAIEGTGIGLSITKRLTELMNGKIDFKSALGQGSTFWVDLPIARSGPVAAEAAIAALAPDSQAIAADALRSQPEPAPVDLGRPHRRILYVEDNPALVRLIERALSQLGHVSLTTVHTAELGLVAMRSMAPDLILIDLGAVDIIGQESHRRLMAMASERRVAVLDLGANQAIARDTLRADAGKPFAGNVATGAELVDIPRLLSEIERRIGLPG